MPGELYIHEDIMGSARRFTDGNGVAFAEIEYDVWGLPCVRTGENYEDFLNPRYTNHTYDEVLGAYHAQFRFFDAGSRGFVQEDPVKDRLNWYGYCENNPLGYVDPLGLQAIVDFFVDIWDWITGVNKNEQNGSSGSFSQAPTMTPSPAPTPTLKPTPTLSPTPTPASTSSTYYPSLECVFTMSPEGVGIVKMFEGSDSYLKKHGIGEFKDGKLIGIYPHYDNKGFLTFGYGHLVKEKNLAENQALIDKYCPKADLMGKQGKVPGSSWQSLESAEKQLDADLLTMAEKVINDFAGLHVQLEQHQLDALLLVRFKAGNVGMVYDLYDEKKYSEENLRKLWPETDSRKNQAYEMYINKNYDYIGK